MDLFFQKLFKRRSIKPKETIALIKSRNEKGLEMLYDDYASVLMGIIIRIVRRKETAEEILQLTFMKVWEGIDKYDENKSSLFTWMSTIARNTAIDKRRLVSFQNERKTENLDNLVSMEGGILPSSSQVDVKRLKSMLDEKYIAVLDYVYLQGYSQREAAELLDIPLGTVKTRIRQAINILREELKNEKNLFIGFIALIIILLLL